MFDSLERNESIVDMDFDSTHFHFNWLSPLRRIPTKLLVYRCPMSWYISESIMLQTRSCKNNRLRSLRFRKHWRNIWFPVSTAKVGKTLDRLELCINLKWFPKPRTSDLNKIKSMGAHHNFHPPTNYPLRTYASFALWRRLQILESGSGNIEKRVIVKHSIVILS